MCTDGTIERYVDFYTDFAFKRLFGTEINKDLLISFLNALLHGREVITNLTYLNAERLGTQEYDRRAVFDVYCENELGEKFIVEMQKGEQQFLKDRSLYYTSFAIREQAPKGQRNYELKGVYTIGILNFQLHDSEDDANYYHEVKLVDTESGQVFYDKLTLIYLEMPKFVKTEGELETLFDKWMYAIKHLATLMERPQVLQERVFTRLFEAAEIAKYKKVDRYEYLESLKNMRDMYSVIETAELRGEEKGVKIGEARGEAKGERKAMLRVARGMKQQGLSVEQIAQFTSLSLAEIEKL